MARLQQGKAPQVKNRKKAKGRNSLLPERSVVLLSLSHSYRYPTLHPLPFSTSFSLRRKRLSRHLKRGRRSI
ncbi:hypothetical protein DACRYDRAFT_19560 [Dacryopinax primogenitus]|uniref:Uncharacterized protein n=1 Tax=Dacryopinax primogenitus (strain DJM 731) TaxID=1858805 RepID=M5GBN0_DACPD|nr:uncharacterized protein DACRYDRAFT_19560 [Dacryopinax primogenitus]EJU06384.1 hypothetical protein DACRYDRAFT_19560 [Dacryopinax primogenitus]